MAINEPFCVIESEMLLWPSGVEIPHGRFRLFVAADATHISTETISEFARSALTNGMVYFCAWGQGCERFHDIVDEIIVADGIGEQLFVRPNKGDVIMTTWHDDETLEDALDYFINSARPTDGFEPHSEYWVAICLTNHVWRADIQRRLEATDFRTLTYKYFRPDFDAKK
jgi:hypothetical protein